MGVLAAVAMLALGPGAGRAAATPRNAVPPEVLANQNLTILECDGGTWEGTTGDFTFQWLRNGTPIPGATEVAYRIRTEDQGHSLSCVVTEPAQGLEPAVEAESFNSVQIPGEAHEELRNISPPHVSGGESVGAVLSCSEGSWNESRQLSYQWRRDGASINGATNSEYLVTSEDEGHALSCSVTATHIGEKVERGSDNSVRIPAAKLENHKPPKITGLPEVGHKLTCSPGEWSGSPSFSYQWLREGTPIATGYEYTVEPADQLQKLVCKVFAETTSGERNNASSAAVSVSGGAPKNVTPPVASVKGAGKVEVGATLVCDKGTWSGAPTPTYEYQWVRDGNESLGPRTSVYEYTVKPADGGHTLACAVFATNEPSKGTVEEGTAISNTLGVPKGDGANKPASEEPPSVSLNGQTLTCRPGTWNPPAEKFAYQWLRDSVAIGGSAAQQPLYTVTAPDEGHSLSCAVTAANEEGATTVTSSNAATIPGSPPFNEVPPHVSGVARIGETLVCLRGEWRGAPDPTYTFQWWRGGTEEVAAGASYQVAKEDRGYPLSCTVTAKNSAGKVTEKSDNSVSVPGVAAHNTSPPTVTGETKVGGDLTCNEGTWIGAPKPTISYQWTREGEAIPGATAAQYAVVSSDRGRSLACRVKGSNLPEGSETVWSATVRIPGERPHDLIAPQVTGDPTLGQTLTCVPGVWGGHPPPVLSYQWLRSGAPIAGATSSSYRISPADQGQLLSCNVAATNSEGSSEAESNGVAVAFPIGQVAGSKTEQPFTAPTTTAPPLSVAEILTALRTQLSRTQHNMKSRGLLKWGHYTFAFAAPTAGTLRLTWYRALAKGAGSNSKRKPIVVAASSTSFTSAATKLATLRLTSDGRRLLKEGNSLKVTVTARFSRPVGLPATWTKTIYVNR
jgi:hypothetical protein